MKTGRIIELSKPDDLTEEDAALMGSKLARIVSSVLLTDELYRVSVAQILSDLEESKHEDTGIGMFNDHLKALMSLKSEGMTARMAAATEELHSAAEIRTRILGETDKAAAVGDLSAIPLIQALIRSAEMAVRVADGIYHPIRQNVAKVVDTAAQIALAKKAGGAGALQRADEIHDSVCSNPECQAHTSH